MITKRQYREGFEAAAALLGEAGVAASPRELEDMEVADFGLNNYPAEGAQIVTFLDTKKVGFKVICLLEGQVLPEHWHTASLGEQGKEETFRVLHGTLHLFVPGEGRKTAPPAGKEPYYTCGKEIVMEKADQVTLQPDTPHWLLGGKGGCVVYSISSWARCALDPFTDPNVVRKTVVADS